MPQVREDPVIYQLRVELTEIEPTIWRRFLVPATVTLHRLHLILQEVMGWSDYHLYRFQIGAKEYGVPHPDNEFYGLRFADSKRTKLGRTVAVEGSTFSYEYDFGDCWNHNLKLEDIEKPEAGQKYPICLEGARACPPEDCGGPSGYTRLLAILANPAHKEYKDARTWVGRSYHPAEFNVERINRYLRPIPVLSSGH